MDNTIAQTLKEKHEGIQVSVVIKYDASLGSQANLIRSEALKFLKFVKDGNQTDMFNAKQPPDPEETSAKKIEVLRHRLEARGDIGKTISGPTIDKKGKIKKPFTHQGKDYVAIELSSDGGATGPMQVLAHEVIPADKYEGDTCTIDERKKDKSRPHFTGVRVMFGTKKMVLGKPVVFFCPAMNIGSGSNSKSGSKPGARVN